MADHRGLVTKSIGAHNTFSDWAILSQGNAFFTLSGTWVATVHFQMSFDKGTTVLDVDTFTANAVETITIPGLREVYFRFGVKTGGYTSGTVVGRIHQ